MRKKLNRLGFTKIGPKFPMIGILIGVIQFIYTNVCPMVAVKLTRIALFSAISPSILNRFSSNFAKVIFYSNPNTLEIFVKLYSVFQKLDHLTCNELKLRRPSITPLN